MSMRSPLSQARGLGSAKEGVSHWWMQRLTAIALIPLTLWFVFSVAYYHVSAYPVMVAWLKNPYVAVTLLLYFAAVFYHAALGVQVVVEDYVAGEGAKLLLIVGSKFGLVVLAVASMFAVLKIAFGVV
jgi:succinate dehydrogenase / fumarate reductase membrane anchor subunit